MNIRNSQAEYGDLKNYKKVAGGKIVTLENFIRHGLAKANKQGCSYAVMNLGTEDVEDINALPNILFKETNNINRNIEHIVLIKGTRVVQISRKGIYSNLEGF